MTNLIVNGDVPVTGWTVTAPDPGPTRVQYGAVDDAGLAFPTSGDALPDDPGTSFFAGGAGRVFAAATQVVSLSDYVEAIAAGTATFTLQAWLGGWSDQEDFAYVGVQFVTTGDPADAVIYQLERVTAEDRGRRTGFVQRTLTGPIPQGDRPDPYANAVMEFQRIGDGTYNDAYVDNLSLTVQTE